MSSSDETKKPRKEKKKKTENVVGTIVELPQVQTEEEKKNTFFDQLPPELKEMKHNFWDHQPVLKISKNNSKLNFFKLKLRMTLTSLNKKLLTKFPKNRTSYQKLMNGTKLTSMTMKKCNKFTNF
jgi:hypothetical protein